MKLNKIDENNIFHGASLIIVLLTGCTMTPEAIKEQILTGKNTEHGYRVLDSGSWQGATVLESDNPYSDDVERQRQEKLRNRQSILYPYYKTNPNAPGAQALFNKVRVVGATGDVVESSAAEKKRRIKSQKN